MSATKNKLPYRWTEYGAVGSRVLGTRFIAFKVPLKKVYDDQLLPWQKFAVSDLVSEMQRQNQELGLIVDLTCTNRYYTQQELPATVKYEKFAIAGTQVPNEEVFGEFVSTVRQFLSQNSNNDKLIGVHCTHGVNRTGYLVCRFMISVLGMAPAKAIEKFNQSRGHNIERQNYLDDLMRRIPRHSACVNGAPGFPSPAFPYVPAPRQWLPHTAALHQQHFRGGPQSFAAHPPIPITWPQHYGPVNGARAWTPMPYNGDTTVRADTRGPGPRLHGQSTPYSRGPAQDRQGAPRHQWQ